MSPNRLAQETSPYLRQHADNPVDWYPWGEEAFARARAEGRPVLLSVGYSACHWCHVMAHESFEDPAVAQVMNDLFVNVKVDREERPDVDAVYMEAVQAISGQGGWPMTVFMTPEGHPFFAGTYYPKTSWGGRPGFVDLLRGVSDAWLHRRSELVGQAEQVSAAIGARTTVPATDTKDGDGISAALLEAAYRLLGATYDAEWGGFGRSPKFPMPTNVELVLRAHARTGEPAALEMAATTLDAMASGGIYDHLGGGFARYSVDTFWMVPHFEKMLYDQAGLVRAYLHAWQVTGEPRYRQVVEETVGYVLRELRQPEGGVCSAEDADSEGEEGRFYVWRHDDVVDIGGPEAVAWYGVTRGGNFEGANILHRPERGDLLRPPEVEAARCRLFDAREARVRPGLDDKVLTEWNAMFVSALAEAGAAFGRRDWLTTAENSADFLLANLCRAGGRWMRSWQRDSGARHLAYAVDYAWLVDAFTRLGEASGHARWMTHACRAADALLSLFADPDGAGFFTTGHDAERLIVRQKDLYDGATPSANSVAAAALLRLAALTGEQRYADAARSLLQLLVDPMIRHPGAFTGLIAAADLVVTGITEIAVMGRRPDLVGAVHELYLPHAVLAWGEPYESPLWEGRQEGLGYVCRDFTCRAPVSEVSDLVAQLRP